MTTGKLILTEDGFCYGIASIKADIICAKIINSRREVAYNYSIIAGKNRVGQVISSKKLPFEDDQKRDNKITSILVGRMGLKTEDSDQIISALVESFNALSVEEIEKLKTIPDKNSGEKKETTIEGKYGSRVYSLAQKILSDPYCFQLVRHVLDFDIAGEYQKKMLIFTLILTAFIGRPTWVIIAGKQAEGKSRLLEKIFELLPEMIKERMNSGKLAAIYRKGVEN